MNDNFSKWTSVWLTKKHTTNLKKIGQAQNEQHQTTKRKSHQRQRKRERDNSNGMAAWMETQYPLNIYNKCLLNKEINTETKNQIHKNIQSRFYQKDSRRFHNAIKVSPIINHPVKWQNCRICVCVCLRFSVFFCVWQGFLIFQSHQAPNIEQKMYKPSQMKRRRKKFQLWQTKLKMRTTNSYK